MRLLRKGYWKKPSPFYSIESAVERELEGGTYDSGQLETLSQTISQISIFLGVLVAKLHASGKLSDEDLLSLLPSFEKEP